jgi:hypothetical protein
MAAGIQTQEHLESLSLRQLFDQWRVLEVRAKFWFTRSNGNITHPCYVNVQRLLSQLYEEIERRAELLPTEILMYLIESGEGFSFNPNSKK